MRIHRFALVIASSLLLGACGGGNTTSVLPAASSEPEATAATSIFDPFEDWDPFEGLSDISEDSQPEEQFGTTYEIAIGGKLSAFPERYWNPQAAFDGQRFAVSPDDHNLYELTINLQAGDIACFFFDYDWGKIIDYKDVDWDYNKDLAGVDSYVSEGSEEERISKKVTGIHIRKSATYTFRYYVFGTVFEGLKSGMVLSDLKAIS